MDPAVVLLIFLVVAVATVVISLLVQQNWAKRSNGVADRSQVEALDERRPSEDAGPNPTIRDEHGDAGPPSRSDELNKEQAEHLEAVADRERRHAERAEAQARRLREPDDGTLGPAPRDQRARRAGVAADDLDY